MNAKLQKRIDSLQYHATCYEVALAAPDGRRYLVCYTSGRSRASLVRAVRHYGQALIALTGAAEIKFGPREGDGLALGGHTLNFTGCTQRDAYLAGELPFVLDVVKARAIA